MRLGSGRLSLLNQSLQIWVRLWDKDTSALEECFFLHMALFFPKYKLMNLVM